MEKKETTKKTENKTKKTENKSKKTVDKKTTEKAKTKKPATKKTVEKKKIVKLEEEPIIEEKKTIIKDEIPEVVLDEQPVIDKSHDYSKIIIGIVSVLIIGLLLLIFINNKKNNNEHPLSLLCEECFDQEDTFALPANYKLCEDGSFFIEEDGILKYKGGMYAGQMDEETYLAQVEEIKAQFEEIEEYEVNDLKILSFGQQYEENTYYEYTFIYKDSAIIELVLINPEDNIRNQIIDSINY